MILFLNFFFFHTPFSWELPSKAYLDQYKHLKLKKYIKKFSIAYSKEPFLIILVNARHLDYTNNRAFFKTLAKHPSDSSKNGDVGHAWIFLKGSQGVLEGGHTGEFGKLEPKYFDGVMDLFEQRDPNPIRYLWKTLNDGAFQKGAGGHIPTCAIKVDLTEEQYIAILSFVKRYQFQKYSLRSDQCVNFVCRVAALGGLFLDGEITMKIESQVILAREKLIFWTDPKYEFFNFLSPDVLEKSMIEAVLKGKAEYALPWYLYNFRTCLKSLKK